MLKLLHIFALLYATVQASPEWNFLTIQAANSVSVRIAPDIYTLSVEISNTLRIFSSNKTFTPCNFAVNGLAPRAMSAKVLSISKKIIAWQDPQDDNFKFNHTVLLIDPARCEYQYVPLPNDEPAEDWSLYYVNVLAYEDSFDVFFPSRRVCWPCRFNSHASRIPLEHQTGSEDDRPLSFFIEPLDGSTPERGYLYVHVFDHNLTSVVKILDPDFKVLKQVYIDRAVHATALKYQNKEQTIAICHSTPNAVVAPSDDEEPWEQVTRCDRLNANLQTIVSSRVETPGSHFIVLQRHVTLQIDARNNLHFAALMMPKGRGYNIIRYFGLDPTGKSVGRARVKNGLSRSSDWLVRSYLEEDTMILVLEETSTARNKGIMAMFDVTKQG